MILLKFEKSRWIVMHVDYFDSGCTRTRSLASRSRDIEIAKKDRDKGNFLAISPGLIKPFSIFIFPLVNLGDDVLSGGARWHGCIGVDKDNLVPPEEHRLTSWRRQRDDV
jgi:hypothetical protein